MAFELLKVSFGKTICSDKNVKLKSNFWSKTKKKEKVKFALSVKFALFKMAFKLLKVSFGKQTLNPDHL